MCKWHDQLRRHAFFWLGQLLQYSTYRRDSAIGSGTYGISRVPVGYTKAAAVVIRHDGNKEKAQLKIE